jgi:hypothetical protein
MATIAKPFAYDTDHAACLDFWISLGVRDASVLHIDMHHDLDSLERGTDEGNFLRAAIERGIVSSVTWVVPLRRDMMRGAAAKTFLGSLPADIETGLDFSNGAWATRIAGVRVDIAPCDGFRDLKPYDLVGLDLDVFYHFEFGGPLTPPDWILTPLQALIESIPTAPLFVCSGLEDGYVPTTFAPLFDDFRRVFEDRGQLCLDAKLLALTQRLEQMRLGRLPLDAEGLQKTIGMLGIPPLYRMYFEAWIAYLDGRVSTAADGFAKTRDLLIFHTRLEALAAYRAGQAPRDAVAQRSRALAEHRRSRRLRAN